MPSMLAQWKIHRLQAAISFNLLILTGMSSIKWTACFNVFLRLVLILALSSPLVWAKEPRTKSDSFMSGVEVYRQGHYSEAQQIFERLHQGHPEQSNITYYLAMSEAQLGNFKDAKRLYDEVILIDPQSETAALAEQGLAGISGYLNSSTALDAPPNFSRLSPQPQAPALPVVQPQTAQTPPQTGMSAQDMMLMQMMMGNGNSNNNTMNWMQQLPNDPNNPGNQNPYQNIDPNIMSTMMMNQMLQNFSFESKKDDD